MISGRRLACLATPLMALALLVLPGSAGAVVYCVPNETIDPSCTAGQGKNKIQDALTAAQTSTAVADTVRIGPGSYSEANLQYSDLTATNVLHLIGAGTTQTKLTLPSTMGIQTGLSVTAPAGSTVSDLAMTIPTNTDSNGDIGISLGGAVLGDRLLVDGPSASNAFGLFLSGTPSVAHSSVNLPFALTDNTGLQSDGSSTIADSSIHANRGISHSGTTETTTVVRSSVQASALGMTVDSGTIDVTDSLIDLGTNPGAVGLDANNSNAAPFPKSINANHLTVVGGGAGSIGFRVWATAPAAAQTSTGTLTNSVISGPMTSISRRASNNGAPMMNSQANVTVGYSNYSPPGPADDMSGAHGTGSITVAPAGTQTNFAPGFVNPGAGDYHLAAGSALIDIGDPAAPPSGELDIDGDPRAVTGACPVGPGRQDIGADEFVPNCPNTTPPHTGISAPSVIRIRRKRTLAFFSLTSTEPDSTFKCSLDGSPFFPCVSPLGLILRRGRHSLTAVAIDKAGNMDPNPARVVVTVRGKKHGHHKQHKKR